MDNLTPIERAFREAWVVAYNQGAVDQAAYAQLGKSKSQESLKRHEDAAWLNSQARLEAR